VVQKVITHTHLRASVDPKAEKILTKSSGAKATQRKLWQLYG
jgi:hypothetical protein